MEFDELMQLFAKGSGIPSLVSDDLGRYKVEIDDMTVVFRSLPDDGLVETSAEVCKVTDKVRDSLFQLMMEGMFMGRATCGNALAYDEESERVYMRHTDCLSLLDETSFRNAVERFVNILEEWRILAGGLTDIADAVAEAKAQASADSRLSGLNGLSV